MDKERSQRLAALIEKVGDSHAEFEGQDAKFEYVFYPHRRQNPITRRLKSGGGYFLQTDEPVISLAPDCQLQFVVYGVEGEEFGFVDVDILGNSKAVERLRELTAFAGRLIPDKFSGLDQFMAPGETARERAHCLALIARLSIGPTEDHGIQTLTAESDGDEYHVAVVEDGFWAVHSLLQVFAFVDESAAGGTKKNVVVGKALPPSPR